MSLTVLFLSQFQLELDTGLPRHQLLYLASILERKIDIDKNGKVTRNEWEQWISAQSKPKTNNKAIGGVMQVVAYSPTFSCCPPPLFIIGISCIEILLYLLW